MLFKECFKIHILEYRTNQGNVFPKKSSYCKDHAIQGFVNQGPTVLHYFEHDFCHQNRTKSLFKIFDNFCYIYIQKLSQAHIA